MKNNVVIQQYHGRILIQKISLPMKKSYLTFNFKYHETNIPRDKHFYLNRNSDCL